MIMPTSITQSQNSLLSSGFLNDLGTTGGNTFRPDATTKALIELAALLITTAQKNLNAAGQVSTGNLSDSFKVRNPSTSGNIIRIQVEAADYYDFQNKGVKGTSGGSSRGGYSFKNDNPNDEMVKSISEWMQRAGMTTANTDAKKTISGQEIKDHAVSQLDNAYKVARSIKQRGIKGSGYFDKAVVVAQEYAKDILGKSLAVDVQASLPKKIGK